MLETGIWLLLVFLAPLSVPIVTFQSISLNRRGGKAGGTAEISVVAGGQHSGNRRGDRCEDRCGDQHRDQRLVGLVVLAWWPVSGFGDSVLLFSPWL